jgi:hypothetical protein
MKNEKVLLGFGVLVLVMTGLFVAPAFLNPAITTQEDNSIVKYTGRACIYKNGELIECKHNTVTNQGKDYIKLALGTGVNESIFTLALGNSTVPAAASTALGSEWVSCGLDKKNGTYLSNGASNGNWSTYYTWTSTCDNAVINTTGLYKVNTASGLFAGLSFTSTTLQTNDQVMVNYTVSIT